MNNLKRMADFCMNQKSISTIIFNFIDRFMAWYEDEDKTEQEILAQCVLQMFRKYYYSALDPDMIYTPAKIVNTLCEREFGAGLMIVPRLSVVPREKKIFRLQYDFITFEVDNHPLVKDMELFLQTAAAGIRMESPGIPLASEYSSFKKSCLLYDRHYFNIISLIALEAGYIECKKSQKNYIAKPAAKAGEFAGLNNEEKLRTLIESAITLCSKMFTQAFPELHKEFTAEKIRSFLRKPKCFEATMGSVFKLAGLNLKKIDRSLLMENLAEIMQATGLNGEKIAKLFWLQNMLDIYFFTPFGYYLQLIQPVYPELYDMAVEFDELLLDIDDFHEVRNRLFSLVGEYQLTALGELLLSEEQKSEPGRKLAKNIGDEEMFQVVLASADYMRLEEAAISFDDEDFDDEEETDDDFQLTMKNLFDFQPLKKSQGAKIIPFPVKTKSDPPEDFTDQVFVFKVKLFYAKRIWRQIEIKGTQSLHELHKCILDAFRLDPEHLYAFFMSNKFWDKKTEYSHPAAESRSASKIKISGLQLNLKQKFAYIYDFGDEHRFEVELIAMQELAKKVKYPREIKRNKPVRTVCDECQSEQNPIEWYCNDHDSYLCNNCALDKKHEGCFITNAML